MPIELLDLDLNATPTGDGWTVAAVDYAAAKRCWTRRTVADVPVTCRVVYEGAEPKLVPIHADDPDASDAVKAILSRPAVVVVARPLDEKDGE